MKKAAARALRDIALTVLILIVSTLLGVLFRQWNFHKTNIVVVYLFSVLLVSRFTRGYGCGTIRS